MNILRSIVYGLWRGLDVLRRFLHLVLLLVVFGFVVGVDQLCRARSPDRPA